MQQQPEQVSEDDHAIHSSSSSVPVMTTGAKNKEGKKKGIKVETNQQHEQQQENRVLSASSISTASTHRFSIISNDSSITSSGSNVTTLSTAVLVDSKLELLPLEVWNIIASYLCPSQLCSVAQVSRTLAAIVPLLDLWEMIYMIADLGVLKSKGKKSTHYGMVLSASERLCELCYKVCKRLIVYEFALPVLHHDHHKFIRMCLDCRRNYYAVYPEPTDEATSQEMLLQFGGRIGVHTHQQRLESLRVNREERKRVQRQVRFQQVERSLAAAGIWDVDQTIPEIESYIRRGTHAANEISALASIVQNEQRRRAMGARQQELVQRLSTFGLQLPNECPFSNDYIATGVGDVDAIATCIVETTWYLRATEYNNFRYIPENPPERGYPVVYRMDNNAGRMQALYAYVQERLDTGRWNDISTDPETELRPPIALWPHIRYLIQSVWSENARSRFLVAGVDECLNLLLQYDPTDPLALNNQLFMHVLDQGARACITRTAQREQQQHAVAATRETLLRTATASPTPPAGVSSSSAPSLAAAANNNNKSIITTGLQHVQSVMPTAPPTTTFSAAFRDAIGAEQFAMFIDSNRKSVMNKALCVYTDRAMHEALPPDISTFVVNCKAQVDLSARLYNELEHQFIETQVPSIAQQEMVHPRYLICVLKTLRQYGEFGV